MLLATAGCAPLTPRLDSDFAGAVRQAVTTQTRDRSAAARNAGMDAAGLDGVAAKEVMDRYQKSFRTPEATASVFTIGVSGGQGTP
jgi:hypothetical protein